MAQLVAAGRAVELEWMAEKLDVLVDSEVRYNNGHGHAMAQGKADVAAAAGRARAAAVAASAAAVEATSAPSRRAVACGILCYAACSSTLLVINKVALHVVPNASVVLVCQFIFSATGVRVIKVVIPQEDVEYLSMEKARPFFAASLVFFICLLSNTKALRVVNVETVIAARCCTPIVVAAVERLALGKDLPTLRGMLSLMAVIVGAVVYATADAELQLLRSPWLAVYVLSLVVEMVFVKFIVETVKMSTWTRVYYNNALSIPMAVVSALATGDAEASLALFWTAEEFIAVFVSCVVGLGISYAGFHLRKLISATSFTVVGVVCKLVTILINDVIWTQHSNAMGHCGLLVCIAACFAYEQSKRKR